MDPVLLPEECFFGISGEGSVHSHVQQRITYDAIQLKCCAKKEVKKERG